jgi:hypothetical protein
MFVCSYLYSWLLLTPFLRSSVIQSLIPSTLSGRLSPLLTLSMRSRGQDVPSTVSVPRCLFTSVSLCCFALGVYCTILIRISLSHTTSLVNQILAESSLFPTVAGHEMTIFRASSQCHFLWVNFGKSRRLFSLTPPWSSNTIAPGNLNPLFMAVARSPSGSPVSSFLTTPPTATRTVTTKNGGHVRDREPPK